MNEFRLSLEAEAQLDGIWLHIARQSGSIDIANRIIDNITDRFWLLASRRAITLLFIGSKVTVSC
jgi:plasmid stabilization system protein ParE